MDPIFDKFKVMKKGDIKFSISQKDDGSLKIAIYVKYLPFDIKNEFDANEIIPVRQREGDYKGYFMLTPIISSNGKILFDVTRQIDLGAKIQIEDLPILSYNKIRWVQKNGFIRVYSLKDNNNYSICNIYPLDLCNELYAGKLFVTIDGMKMENIDCNILCVPVNVMLDQEQVIAGDTVMVKAVNIVLTGAGNNKKIQSCNGFIIEPKGKLIIHGDSGNQEYYEGEAISVYNGKIVK
jgi:hypothetical protein